MTAAVPPLDERRRPGLSETLGNSDLLGSLVRPDMCRSCAATRDLQRWRECDPFDKPTMVVVVLCGRCANKLIEPHPRLYIPLSYHEPFPGVMKICVDCPARSGVSCTSPLAKHNGGRGIKIEGPRVTSAHIKAGRGRSGWIKIYSGEATDCAGKQLALQPAPAAE